MITIKKQIYNVETFQIEFDSKISWNSSIPDNYKNFFVRVQLIILLIISSISIVGLWFLVDNLIKFSVIIIADLSFLYSTYYFARYLGKKKMKKLYMKNVSGDGLFYPHPNLPLEKILPGLLGLIIIIGLRSGFFGDLSFLESILVPITTIVFLFNIKPITSIIAHNKWILIGEIDFSRSKVKLNGYHWFQYEEKIPISKIDSVSFFREWNNLSESEIVSMYFVTNNVRFLGAMFFVKNHNPKDLINDMKKQIIEKLENSRKNDLIVQNVLSLNELPESVRIIK